MIMENKEYLTDAVDKYFQIFLNYLPKIIAAIVIFFIGLWLIKVLVKSLRKLFEKRDYDEALRNFLLNVIDLGLKILLTITVIAKLGVETSSLVAAFGAASLAIGLALQGSLSNFAGGVIIILLRPFRIGDYIEADGISGTVKNVSIFYTELINFNNLLVLIPNGQLSNKRIINYTTEGRRKDAITIRIPYGASIEKARQAMIGLLVEQKGTFSDPAPQVVVGSLTQDCVELSVRFVSSTADFWDIHWYTLEHAEERLNQVGIQMAYPQYHLRVVNEGKSSDRKE